MIVFTIYLQYIYNIYDLEYKGPILMQIQIKISKNLGPTDPVIKNRSTPRLTPRTDNDSSLLFAALGKAEPLISTVACQKFGFDLDGRTDGRYQVHYLPASRSINISRNLGPTDPVISMKELVKGL